MYNLSIDPCKKYPLPAFGTWKESVHVFDDRTINAIKAAWAAERPLLVRGDPGVGKTQLARAVACACGWEFVSEVINVHTDIQDLWFRFDAVSRLGQAQILNAIIKQDCNQARIDAELNPKKYLSPGVLWWAYDWKNAQQFYADSRYKQYHPHGAENHDSEAEIKTPDGVVLLLDEIDKADADLPNSLLETLDNARFRIPWLNQSIGFDKDNPDCIRPLVVITTNEDRQLPPAFVRRCLVLNLDLPDKEDKLLTHLAERGRQHFSDDNDKSLFSDNVLHEAARQLHKDRIKAKSLGYKPPGQAEYLDILRVLSRLADDEKQQLELLEDIKDFALKKHLDMEQETGGDDAEPES